MPRENLPAQESRPETEDGAKALRDRASEIRGSCNSNSIAFALSFLLLLCGPRAPAVCYERMQWIRRELLGQQSQQQVRLQRSFSSRPQIDTQLLLVRLWREG